jgi:hypothetical protein
MSYFWGVILFCYWVVSCVSTNTVRMHMSLVYSECCKMGR